MIKKYLFLFLTAIMGIQINAEEVKIKSLQVFAGKDEAAFPVIFLYPQNRNMLNEFITIQFDIEAAFRPDIRIEFRFCDRNWKPYDNEFLRNRGRNIDYSPNLKDIPLGISGADYHYKQSFPNKSVTFPYSGKYIFRIYDTFNPDITFAEGKFIVVRSDFEVNIKIEKSRQEGRISDNTALDRIFRINTNFYLPDSFYPNELSHVEIIENRLLNFPVNIYKNKNYKYRFVDRNGARNFSFRAWDIYPGNEYRQMDIRDDIIYFGTNFTAQRDGIETSRFYDKGSPDLNGGFVLSDYEDVDATYHDVQFKLRADMFSGRDIYLTGAFTDWRVYRENKMNESGGLFKITKNIKRGKYDYQYVIVEEDGSVNRLALEGNFWETSNSYLILIYYKETTLGGYDKIIAAKRINS